MNIKEEDYKMTTAENGTITLVPIKTKQAKSYEELGVVKGWRADSWRGTLHEEFRVDCGSRSIIWATKEQAEASKAMAQLSQLMQAVNEGWEPNWYGGCNFVIYFRESGVLTTATNTNTFLALKTEEIRDEFLELHRVLIMTARPLL